jgi:hypothetical protein
MVARRGVIATDRRSIFALLGANAISQVGNVMTVVAGAWFVLETTGSPARVGLISASLGVGAVVSAVLGGPWCRNGHQVRSAAGRIRTSHAANGIAACSRWRTLTFLRRHSPIYSLCLRIAGRAQASIIGGLRP